ncbi:hypothetical protein CYLTODRAFT_413953 [Cylindrobasidium torrendii FP15055 ss-10]|uniref:Uncharacterized protein n=1 Tax=Cylindrobasidium torrendii FP15055 ss-10 TaxID=1314674 RepID=A0A0D7AZA3_9AGAR|nr:hypothetical protein CYLTODRAFT_413953 [Cylindrobasidium torrendii FP15055 ss-10]
MTDPQVQRAASGTRLVLGIPALAQPQRPLNSRNYRVTVPSCELAFEFMVTIFHRFYCLKVVPSLVLTEGTGILWPMQEKLVDVGLPLYCQKPAYLAEAKLMLEFGVWEHCAQRVWVGPLVRYSFLAVRVGSMMKITRLVREQDEVDNQAKSPTNAVTPSSSCIWWHVVFQVLPRHHQHLCNRLKAHLAEGML